MKHKDSKDTYRSSIDDQKDTTDCEEETTVTNNRPNSKISFPSIVKELYFLYETRK